MKLRLFVNVRDFWGGTERDTAKRDDGSDPRKCWRRLDGHELRFSATSRPSFSSLPKTDRPGEYTMVIQIERQ